jgi:hypothetical protein
VLEVSLNLKLAGAVLFGIGLAKFDIKIDSLNSPTAKPIPGGDGDMGPVAARFKSAVRQFMKSCCYGPIQTWQPGHRAATFRHPTP